MMKSTGLFFLLIVLAYAPSTAQEKAAATAALIPAPVEVKFGQGFFTLGKHTVIRADTGLAEEAALLNGFIRQQTGLTLAVSSKKPSISSIDLDIDPLRVKEPEGYQLLISSDAIRITGHDGAGILYGIQTWRQLWQHSPVGALSVKACIINDYPRFAYRGMHLDVSRHFFSVAFIKKYIDLLSLYKLNTFHWHLTDDQGWRIEIKKYPRLQSVAAWRDETLIGHKKEWPHRFDGKRYGGYYTQEQVKEVVRYATARHITVIPEIEMPGHALAALSAYPQLGCTGGPYKAATCWGIFDDVFCAGKDSVFTFLQDVLDEVMELFPSTYLHVGGDECPKQRWAACPHCRKRMQEEHLANEHELQSYFIKRISRYIDSKGRHLIGWDEILEGGLAPGATVMSWGGIEGAISAARQHHHVIMTPEDELYFDHYQSLYPAEPLAAGGYTSLKDVYNYQPLPDTADRQLLPYITGIQGQLWSEYLPTPEQAEYMLMPRAMALAERAWSPETRKSYPDFLSRLRSQKKMLDNIPVNSAGNFDEINYTVLAVNKGSIRITLRSDMPGGKIYYSTDGSRPGLKSRLYKGPVNINQAVLLRAALYNGGKPVGRIFEQSFHIHKAIGASVALQNAPTSKYGGPASKLVNGIYGVHRYNDQQWMGFSGNDLEAVIDLEKVQPIKVVGANILQYHWQRMWAPVWLQFAVSVDGIHYKTIARQDEYPVNGINKVRIKLQGITARYIKVTGINKGIIPLGEYGAGANSLLMIDELIVN